MSKIVLAGILGGLTVVTGLLFYSANLRDSKSSSYEDGSDSDSDSESDTEPKTKTRTNKKEEEKEIEVIEEKPISKKRERHATTSKNVSRTKSNTRRNRNR
jgi:FtsZ-interacting cell division protein ZipA